MKRRSTPRKICVITGTRAEYGILSPVIKRIESSKKLRAYLIATCMHLMKEFGYTVKEIEKDGFNIYAKVDISCERDSSRAAANSIGKALSKFSAVFARLSPDVVLLLGDRGEMLAAAVAASYMGIPVAHIHGGEVSGHIDGIIRHAITKLSHVHFAATTESKERILKLGEDKWRVFVTGAPALDRIIQKDFTSKKEIQKKYGICEKERFFLLVQHPASGSVAESEKQMAITLEAIKELKIKTIIIYPNSDIGSGAMIRLIKKCERYPFIKTFKSIPHRDYLGLMNIASVLIGNSSSGIIEAPSFKLAVVNTGSRQNHRQCSSNVIDVGYEKGWIKTAIERAIYDKKFKGRVKKCGNPYGDGHASERIIKILHNIKLDERLLQKQLTY